MKIMVRRIAVIALAAVVFHSSCAANAAAAWAASADRDVLGYVRIEHPQALIDKLDAVTAKLGARASDLMPMLAQKFLKNAMLTGVDMRQPWMFVVLNPQKFTNNLAAVVGVSDTGQWLDSFGKGGVSRVIADTATANAPVRHFSETVEEFDQRGYMTALRAGDQPDPAVFKKKITRDYFITVCEQHGLIAGSALLLDALSPTAKPNASVRGDFVAGFHLPPGLALYEKDIQRQKDALAKLLQAATARSGTSFVGTSAQGQLMAAYLDAMLEIAKQVNWAEAAGELEGGTLKLQMGVQPLAGTALAKVLSDQTVTPPSRELLALMPADAAMLTAWHLNYTPEAIDLYERLLQTLLRSSGSTNAPTAAAAVKDMLRESLTVYAGDAATALKTSPTAGRGIEMFHAAAITDPVRAREAQGRVLKLGVDLASGGLFSQFISNAKYERNVAQHGGVAIDQLSYDLASMSQSQTAVANVYGTNFHTRLAFAGHYGLSAAGPNADANLKRLVDAARQSPVAVPAQPRFEKAIASYPAKNNGVFFMKLEDYFSMMISAAPGVNSMEMQRLASLLAEAKADIAGYVLLQPTSAMIQVDLPLQTVLDVSRKMQPAAEPPSPGPTAPPSK